MFLLSFRFSRKKMLVTGLVLLVAAAAVIGGLGIKGSRDALTVGSGELSQQAKVTTKAKDNQQRVDFICSFGWEIDSEPMEVMEVIIPEEFDETYTAYNSMQMTQGFDLSKFSGKRVKRYSYAVLNYPGEPEVRVNLLVSGDKVIGGDVCSTSLDGFMHGFSMTD
ncbi:DUF4830 domain-containing protein [Oscillospiraceae bacterium MB08-C2-2]|nr:DUF4830 domain-containing protein [Oscillospiraceae bacterium MB08-C2-2]